MSRNISEEFCKAVKLVLQNDEGIKLFTDRRV